MLGTRQAPLATMVGWDGTRGGGQAVHCAGGDSLIHGFMVGSTSWKGEEAAHESTYA